jgi:hypothetical protein
MMDWVITKFNGDAGSIFGKPLEYTLYIGGNVFIYASALDKWINLRDLVGYYPFPPNKNYIISKLEALVVLGLHDGNVEDVGKK